MFTCYASSARTLLHALHPSPSPSSVFLFALAPSPSTPPDVLSHVTSALTQRYPKHVGCISAPLPHQHLDPRAHSCSLAYAFVDGVPFRSTISGRAEVHVGRWHAARKRHVEDTVSTEASHMQILADASDRVDWEHIWNRSNSTATLPDALRNVDPSAIDTIFYFSDKAPEGLATVLQTAFPHANKLSLIASSTPFITGRPVTLFFNGSVLSNGAIGIAFSPHSSPPPAIELSLPPLSKSDGFRSTRSGHYIVSSEGNLILSLDSGNPTHLLLSAIQKHGISSLHSTWVEEEDEFYVGVIDPSSQQVSQLHRIHAGDPSRGSIALDIDSAPREGAIVRLYHLPKDTVPYSSVYTPDKVIPNTISLLVAPETKPLPAHIGHETAHVPATDGNSAIVSHTFLAASENGFTLSCGTQMPWWCDIPGGQVRLSL